MVQIDYCQTSKMRCCALAPGTLYTYLIYREAEACLEAAHGQLALLLGRLGAAISVD